MLIVHDKSHPHYGTRVVFTGKTTVLFGKKMALVRNEDDSEEEFYVNQGQVKEVHDIDSSVDGKI